MKLAILHFQPIEGYPPITNLLNYLSSKKKIELLCLSTSGHFRRKYENEAVEVKRFGEVGIKIGSVRKLFMYLFYNFGCLFYLLIQKPEIILYYESISSWPVYIYRLLFNKSVRLFIHYHEYISPREYQEGMKLLAYIHSLEKKLYPLTEWISQTNQFRMDKFIKDEKLHEIESDVFKIMPNYPPQFWLSRKNKAFIKSSPLKLVYVGYSLSFETMYVKELFDWVQSMDGSVDLDCYLQKSNTEVNQYIDFHKIQNVKLMEAIDYLDLPGVLQDYSIGLIIYKGTIDNFKFNAPNKLFEYLACGLDVWFPNVMDGSLPYVCDNEVPRVLNLDFENLNQYNHLEIFSSVNLPCRKINYNCESEYLKIYKAIISEG